METRVSSPHRPIFRYSFVLLFLGISSPLRSTAQPETVTVMASLGKLDPIPGNSRGVLYPEIEVSVPLLASATGRSMLGGSASLGYWTDAGATLLSEGAHDVVYSYRGVAGAIRLWFLPVIVPLELRPHIGVARQLAWGKYVEGSSGSGWPPDTRRAAHTLLELGVLASVPLGGAWRIVGRGEVGYTVAFAENSPVERQAVYSVGLSYRLATVWGQ